MSKIDCSNIFNFVSEWERRNRITENMYVKPNWLVESSISDALEELQKWSDANPKLPRSEKFIKMCEENGFEEFVEHFKKCHCKEYPEGHGMPCVFEQCFDCRRYWEENI